MPYFLKFVAVAVVRVRAFILLRFRELTFVLTGTTVTWTWFCCPLPSFASLLLIASAGSDPDVVV
jgi:hypothetical protein